MTHNLEIKMKTKIDVLDKLPNTAEAQLQNYDQAVATFVELLRRVDDPLAVMDQMFVYYTKVIHHQDEQIKKMLPYYNPPIVVNKFP